MFSKEQDSGVSPVIGVILMVAVTVALVALVTVIVFDIGSDVSESPDATVELSQENGDIKATLLRNENVETLRLEGAYNSSLSDSLDYYTTDTFNADNQVGYPLEMSSAGDTATVQGTAYEDTNDDGSYASADDTSYSLSDGDQVQVIAVMPDGSEEVLTSTEYDA